MSAHRLRSSLAVGIIAFILAVSAPVPAWDAEEGCGYDVDTLVVTARVDSREDGSMATLRVGDDGAILFDGAPCQTATVRNSDLIRIEDIAHSPHAGAVAVDLGGGPFAPGATPEAGTSSEIEFDVRLEMRHKVIPPVLSIVGDGGPDHIRYGSRGINLNADESDGIDIEIRRAAMSPHVAVRISGRRGDDHLRGDGGAGTGAALFTRSRGFPGGWGVTLYGGAGDDILVSHLGDRVTRMFGGPGRDHLIALAAAEQMGGEDDDRLRGGPGHDDLLGGPGDDRLEAGDGEDALEGGPGDDVMWGGPGADVARHLQAVRGVHADLCVTEPQRTGDGTDTLRGVEGLSGGRFDDVLKGCHGPDRLSGWHGHDRLYGRAGADLLIGGSGDDLLAGGPGHNDVCMSEAGSDTLVGCEIRS
ncbi:MAG: hypothetical protein M3245_01835 [Actinomycetota bacterium]|nr:hypothetical protein [Actinomycetota bacterium]